jgi:hypothetical protein
MGRAAAALIALICWTGIGLQFWAGYSHSHDFIATLWGLARFFTIIGNLALAIVMSAIAFGRRPSPFVLAGVTLAVLLIGIVYGILLAGLHHPVGIGLIANYLLHDVSPVVTAAYWLLLVPRRRLPWSAPWRWVLFPLAYFIYAVVRGGLDHRYPYPFIDVAKLGWVQVSLNAAGIALAFILGGFALVWLDTWRPLGPSGGRH